MADAFILPAAQWKATLDGEDLTDKINPRLLSVSITQRREDEADQLEIACSDADGGMDIPKSGAELKVSLGWARGNHLPLGLIDMGTFRVDEARWSGALDKVTIRARSADFTDALRIRRERSFVEATVRDVISAIAGDNGLSIAIDAALGGKAILALGPGAKSDAALLRLLGKRFDAVATIKNGTLIFAPMGSGKAPGGGKLPSETLDRSITNSAEYQRIERETYGGVIAVWHDRASGERKQVQVGGGGNAKPKRLRKLYASEADARQAAQAADSRIGRARAKISFTLPLGRPDLYPERPITLTGFKPEINAHSWIVKEARHTMDGRGGLASRLELEAVG